jgi:hypothetical protein
VLAGAGVGALLRALASDRLAGAAALVASALAALAFLAYTYTDVPLAAQTSTYQARLVDGLGRAVREAGGPARLRALGASYTGPYFVPAVAWQLHLHISEVGVDPQAPAVLFRERTGPGSAPAPALDAVGGEASVCTLSNTGRWRIVTTQCPGGAS